MTSSCISGSIRQKKVEIPNFFVFNPICLKFGIGANFEMLITKSNPKLRLDNDLSRKIQFSNNFSQNFTEHPSTIALPTVDVPWDWFVVQNSSLLLYSKSQSFRFLLLTVSTQQREEPACGRILPPPGLFRVKFYNMCNYENQTL